MAEQAAHVEAAFRAQSSFVALVAACKPVGPSGLPELLAPTQQPLMAATTVREPGRERKFSSHLSAVSEGIPALGWVALATGSPMAPFVKDMREAAEFWVNRVIKEYKDSCVGTTGVSSSARSDKKQVEWARSWSALLEELRKYVFAHHATGLGWNAKVRSAVRQATLRRRAPRMRAASLTAPAGLTPFRAKTHRRSPRRLPLHPPLPLRPPLRRRRRHPHPSPRPRTRRKRAG